MIGNETDGYSLTASRATGFYRLANINSMKFTTFDVDNDLDSGNCAVKYGGGWWYAGGKGRSCATVRVNSKEGPTIKDYTNTKKIYSYCLMMVRVED